MNFTHLITEHIAKDLKTKIVMIGGPRQVGKTTLAREFITSADQYFSWDDLQHRSTLKSHQINPRLKTVVLDEIHKYARWRTLLKGLYDTTSGNLKILVTGSARLDHFRKGGDSLFGR
jgi:predicted AAA+ superfamily ATPase